MTEVKNVNWEAVTTLPQAKKWLAKGQIISYRHVGNRRYEMTPSSGYYCLMGNVYADQVFVPNVNTPEVMYYGHFKCPEWKNSKKTDWRPCVVRVINDQLAMVYPCTTQYHYLGEGTTVYLQSLSKPSWVVMNELVIRRSNTVRVGKQVEESEQEMIAWWEHRNHEFVKEREAKYHKDSGKLESVAA